MPQPTTKYKTTIKLKPLIRLKIVSKHSHQTHAFHKSLNSQKKLKTPTTNNKAPLNCTRTLMTFNSTLTYNKTSPTSNQSHISHKFFLPLSKDFDKQQQSFDNLQQHSYPQQNNLNIFAKVTAFTNLVLSFTKCSNLWWLATKLQWIALKFWQPTTPLRPTAKEYLDNLTKITTFTHLEHFSQNAQNSKTSCNKVLTSYNKTQQNSYELQPNFEELQQSPL